MPNQSTLPQNQGTAAPTAATPQGLDPSVVNLAKAIRDVESGGNYDARGAAGEIGGYQITPGLWQQYAPKYGIQTPLEKSTPQDQNAFAYNYISDLKGKGFNPVQIASIWNSGYPDPSTVGSSATYNVPKYVTDVYSRYQALKNSPTEPQNTDTGESGKPTYGATFPYSEGDNGLVAGFKALGNLPSSIWGFGEGLATLLMHPIESAKTLGSGAIGAVENLTGENKGGTPDQNQQTANAIGKAFLDRYGSIDALTNTAVNDPFGFGADVASVVFPAAGLIGKGEEASAIASRVARTAIEPVSDIAKTAAEKVTGAVAGGGLNPEAINAAERLNVKLPVGAETTNPAIRSLEVLAATGAGEAKYTERVNTALEQMNKVAEGIVTKTGGTSDIEEAGAAVSQGLREYTKKFNQVVSDLYDRVQESVGDVAAKTERSVSTLDRILSEKEAVGETEGLKYFKDKLDVLNGANGKAAPTFSTLRKVRTALGQKIDTAFSDPFATQNMKQLRQLYAALSQDIRNTVLYQRRPMILRTLDKANAEYAKGAQMIGSQYARTIRRLGEAGQESRIVDSIIKPSTAIEDIPRIMAVVGEKGAKAIRSSFAQKLLDTAKDADGNFRPTGIQRAIKKYGEDKVNAILGADEVQKLKDLGTLTEAISDMLNVVKRETPTGTLIRQALQGRFPLEVGGTIWAIVDLFSGNVVGAAQKIAGIVGLEAGSRFFASEMGQAALRWAATRGSEFAKAAQEAGLTPPPEAGTMGTAAKGSNPPEGGAPNANTRNPVPGSPDNTGGVPAPESAAAGAGGTGVPNSGGTPEGSVSAADRGSNAADNTETPITSTFRANTLGGRIKEALSKYFENNVSPGLEVRDVTKGNQEYNIGLTSVKGRIPSATDDLATEADALYKKGDFAGAQAKYNEALQAGVKTLQDSFDGTGIKIKPRGVGFGIYESSLEPNYDAMATVPRGKEDLFHYILSDIADRNFHQYSMLTYRYAPPGAPYGVVDAERGLTTEPWIRLNLSKPLSAEDVSSLQQIAKESGMGALSLREGGKAIDLINLTNYNKDYDQFIQNAGKFEQALNARGISSEAQLGSAEARFVGSNPDEGAGAASYQQVRDRFRAENPGVFNADQDFTSKVIQRIQNKQSVTPQELEQITKSQDITPLERSVVLDALGEYGDLTSTRIPTANLVAKIEGKSLPVTVRETDQYANYGIREVGLNDYAPEGGQTGAKTLVFETSVEHGNQGHFGSPNHLGHARVYIGEDPATGKKIGYITEIQSDVFQKADLARAFVNQDELVELRDKVNQKYRPLIEKARGDFNKINDEFLDARHAGDHDKVESIRAARDKAEKEYDGIIEEAKASMRNAETELSAKGLSPERQQFLHLGKNDRYQDTLLRGALQYLEKQGVEEVRVATPSSIAKIEGYVNDEGMAPYDLPGGERPRAGMDDLAAGDEIDYLGESWTVVSADGRNITAAPADKVRTFRFSDYAQEEVQARWDDIESNIEQLEKKIGKIPKKGITPAWADKAKKEGIDDPYVENYLDQVTDTDEPLSLSDLEEKVKQTYYEITDFDSLRDIYGKNNVFSEEIGNGHDARIYVVDEGTTPEEFGQPDSYEGGLAHHELTTLDPHPNNLGGITPAEAEKTIGESFDNTQGTVLKQYVQLYDKWLQRLAKEQNIPIKYVEGNGDASWYSMPMTKVKRYLFGA